jgi:Flp pilus assembly pilin Flp
VLRQFPRSLAVVRARLGGPLTREEGVTAVEYALMVAIIAVLLVAAFFAFFQAVEDRYTEVGNCIVTGPYPSECSPGPGAPGGGGG